MQDIISTYLRSLKVKDSTGYELAARECKEYFDGRGIEYPTAEDWKQFEADYPAVYKSKRGKDLSQSTLKQNYVARGKAFYRWCEEQAGMPEGTPSLFPEEEAPTAPPVEAVKPAKEEKPSVNDETEIADGKPVRISFMLDAELHRLLSLLAPFEGKTMTEVMNAGARLYIREHSRQADILRQAIKEARSQ